MEISISEHKQIDSTEALKKPAICKEATAHIEARSFHGSLTNWNSLQTLRNLYWCHLTIFKAITIKWMLDILFWKKHTCIFWNINQLWVLICQNKTVWSNWSSCKNGRNLQTSFCITVISIDKKSIIQFIKLLLNVAIKQYLTGNVSA